MERMVFQNPGGLAGRFVTVRKGDGWFKKVAPGDQIELVDAEGKVLGVADVADGWTGDLARVPASVLEMVHDPLMRTFSGLIVGLRIFYGDPIEPSVVVSAMVLDFARTTRIIT